MSTPIAHPVVNRTPDRTLYRTSIDSPIGELTIVAVDDAVVAIRFDTDRDRRQPDVLAASELADHPVLRAAAGQLAEYFAGERTEFELSLAPTGTAFQLDAWQALRRVPYGTTVSYGEQAAAMGDRRKARAVGAANGRNPIPIVVPCHRVVGSNGHLTGFAGGIEAKAWLLDHELRVRAGS
jgi:methylated-DNA-[protein]-cysteine S-methyltransferase